MSDKHPHFTAPDENLKHRRWVVVAHRAGARILEGNSHKPLSVIQRLDHPQGRMKNAEFKSDEPGHSNDGSHIHAMATEVSPIEHEATVFAKSIATIVESGRSSNKFSELVLVAEPKFMGSLHSHLDKVTAKSLIKTIEKDFARSSDAELIEQLKNLI